MNDQTKSGIHSIDPAEALKHFDSLKDENQFNHSDDLGIVLETQKILRELKATNIRFADPILKQRENAVFFPHTINVIQGQAGVHKSRLAEIICSVLLKKIECKSDLLGFQRASILTPFTVVYVDTERNLSDQFPYALQSMQIRAGYTKEEHPNNFEYISLVQIERSRRFPVLNEYLNYIRSKTKNHLFIVLDVSTDCIADFNKTDISMQLIDLMNMSINKYHVTFLCVIHENPRSEKARGHFGTELMNKASTVMQVGFEDPTQEDTDIIRVKYLKCRSTAKHSPFYIKYSKDEKGLVLAEASEVSQVKNNRKHKAKAEEVIEFLEMYLGDGTEMSRTGLLDKLCVDFDASQRIIEDRIKQIMKSNLEIFNEKGQSCKLMKESKSKLLYYRLEPIVPF